MTITFEYLGDGGVLAHGDGVINGREITELNAVIYATPQKIKRIKYQLVDFRNVTSVDIKYEEIRGLSLQDQRAAKFNPHMIIAVVCADDLVYGLTRVWEAYFQDSPLQPMVFRTMSEAKRWIEQQLSERSPST